MRCLLAITAVIALATAKPELYKENEDFQYSRSSSDEGYKAGYYGAQRGNMGGNYEKSHNMDLLAQHQMSGAVRQVEGELGDGANTKSGSVFTSGNSRGIYGANRYDTSALAGRNFNEGVTIGDSHSAHSSLSSQDAHGSQYSGSHISGHTGSHGLSSGYQTGSLHSGNLQAADVAGAGGYNYERNAEHSSGYEKHSGYTKQSSHGYGSNAYTGSNAQTRMIGNGVPARVVIRPGTTVYIPVAAQTYQHASLHDQNSIDTDAEVLSGADNHAHYSPSSDAKSYESSYSYRKEWEKHHGYPYPSAVPLAVPTMSPYPKNSELYEEALASSGSHNAHSSSHYDRYNSNVKSSSAMQSNHHSGYNAAHNSASSLNSNAHTHGALNSDTGYSGDVNSRPKSYQSSYAYHKSWERQGDPYVIIPGGDGQSSGKLTDASNQYDSHGYTKGKLCCVDADGHIRVARSYNQNQETENLNQQSQNLEDFGQQTQDLTQQSTSKWNEHLEDFGQQTQELTQQSQSAWKENLEDFGQQTQDLTQQSQSNWKENSEDLGQQTQDLKSFGQQAQQQTQQSQTNWKDNLENLSQQTQDLGQQTENRWDKFTAPGQQTESQRTQDAYTIGQKDDGQQSQTSWKLDDFGQTVQGFRQNKMNRQNMSQDKELHIASDDSNNFHQTTLNSDSYNQQNNWHQSTQNHDHGFGQETQGTWHKFDISNQNRDINSNSQVKPVWEQTENNRPQFSDNSGHNVTRQSNLWKFLENDHQNTNTNQQTSGTHSNDRTESSSHGTSIVNLWDKINNLDQFSMSDENNQNEYQYSHGHKIVDNSFQNNWSNSYSQTSDSGMSQSTYMQNYYGTQYGAFKPITSNTFNDKSTRKPPGNFGATDSVTQNTFLVNTFGEHQKTESPTTVKPKSSEEITLVEALRPQDIGRGDIGPEDSSIHGLTTSTKPKINTNHINTSPSTVSYSSENKRYKTPDEIETLSLTTQTERIAGNKNTTFSNKNDTQYKNQLNSENTLSVLSIQESQRKYNQNQYNSSETFDSIHIGGTYNNRDFQSDTLYNNKPTTTTTPISVSQHKPKDVIDRMPKDLKHLDEKQGTEDMVQETQQLGDFGSFVREHKNFDQEIDQQNQQSENLGQFEQQNYNSEQQVQSSWDQDLVNLGQTQQSGWDSKDQVQETQQLEKFGRFNEGQYQTQDFYSQRYSTNDKEFKDKSIKVEDLQFPQSPEKVEEIQTSLKTNAADTETAVTLVPSTEKPGFWKSVGSKFSSAKDTVASWFKKS